MTIRIFLGLFREAYKIWLEDRAQRLGAALAYYALFSIAPLLVIVVSIAGLVFDEEEARSQIISALTTQIGAEAATVVDQSISGIQASGSGVFATVISALILFIGSTNLFAQLKDALNTIWHVRHKPHTNFLRGILHAMRDRLMSTVMVASFGIVLLATLAISAGLTVLSGLLEIITPDAAVVWQGVNLLIGFGVTTLLFALMFKVLPDVQITWHVALVGALISSILFNLGAYLFGLYLRYSGVVSILGAVGSFVVVLIWAYYSAQMIFFGAKFAQVYATAIGKPIIPTHRAISVRPHKSVASVTEREP
ncbi:MAG: YihY/virulence factor BrkB family protein [Anaerolineae bacterium]|nr:YihY/virulence factor BrkB family protein [Anaerolineae bacterium]MCI0610578.1 YihY/virulence factor BrkB family protein [Anaerolineae bacterium]